MNKSFKFLGILFITAVFLVGCQGQKDFPEVEKDNVAHEILLKKKLIKKRKIRKILQKKILIR